MDAFPAKNSVLVMDNCRIHHFAELIVEIISHSRNPCRVSAPIFARSQSNRGGVLGGQGRNHDEYNARGYQAKEILLFACCSVTADKARAFYAHSGYCTAKRIRKDRRLKMQCKMDVDCFSRRYRRRSRCQNNINTIRRKMRSCRYLHESIFTSLATRTIMSYPQLMCRRIRRKCTCCSNAPTPARIL
jgi:hypothetical protein